jgi:hypothetical protein
VPSRIAQNSALGKLLSAAVHLVVLDSAFPTRLDAPAAREGVALFLRVCLVKDHCFCLCPAVVLLADASPDFFESLLYSWRKLSVIFSLFIGSVVAIAYIFLTSFMSFLALRRTFITAPSLLAIIRCHALCLIKS